MHFVIDALGISKPGGGRTAVLMQLSSVFRLDTDNSYTVVVDSPEKAFSGLKNVEQRVVGMRNRLAVRLMAQIVIPVLARSRQANLVHHTKHLGSILGFCPYIITMNDMTILRLPWAHSWVDLAYYKTIQRVTVSRASLILTPSEDARRDIAEYYGADKDRIKLIPYAPSPIFKPYQGQQEDREIRTRYVNGRRYLLFVGIRAVKKNLPTLVRAFSILKKQQSYDGVLLIVGRDYPQSSEISLPSLLTELGIENDVIFTGPVPDDHLPAIYRGADVFAFPSLHEGFGILVLEAMACGVPVVASDASSLPEVVAGAGLLVKELYDDRAWAEAVHRILVDSQLRKTLIASGLRRAGEFSWEKVGRETLDSYLSVVQPSRCKSPIPQGEGSDGRTRRN